MEKQEEAHNIKDPYGSLDGIVSFIQKERMPVVYSQMVPENCRVVALGEHHDNVSAKAEAIRSLSELRAKGFNHLGIEMVQTTMQDALYEYIRVGTKRDEILAHIQKNWGVSNGLKYMEIIDIAKELGMQVVALDIPEEERAQYDRDTLLDKRDELMARLVHETLDENESNKIVTFSGSQHIMKSGLTMANLLRKNGVEPISIQIIGGNSDKILIAERAAAKAGVSFERFMLPARAKFPQREYALGSDWLVYLPESSHTYFIALENGLEWLE